MANIFKEIQNSVISLSGRTFDIMTSKELRELLKQHHLIVKPLTYVNDEIRASHPYLYRNVKNTKYLLYGTKGISKMHESVLKNNTDIIAMRYDEFFKMLTIEHNKFIVDNVAENEKRNKFINFITTKNIVTRNTDWTSLPYDLKQIMNDTRIATEAAGYANYDIVLKPNFNYGDTIDCFYKVTFKNIITNNDVDNFINAINNNKYFTHITGLIVGASVYGPSRSTNNVIEFTLSFTFDLETTKILKDKADNFNSYMHLM